MKHFRSISFIKSTILISLIFTSTSCSLFKKLENASVEPLSEEPSINYKNGLVVSAHPIASEVGVQILKKGGNAIDAAVAVQFALSVVYPTAGNIGGGGFMVYRSGKGETAALDFRETAPGSATVNMYLDSNDNPIKALSIYGQLASGTPGSVDGMVKAHERYGYLAWDELLQPAIDLAAEGFPLTAMQAREFNAIREDLLTYNKEETAFTAKKDWKAGDLVIQADLAHVLSLIRDYGRAGFYEGETADKIVAAMENANGIISHEDLRKYESVWR